MQACMLCLAPSLLCSASSVRLNCVQARSGAPHAAVPGVLGATGPRRDAGAGVLVGALFLLCLYACVPEGLWACA